MSNPLTPHPGVCHKSYTTVATTVNDFETYIASFCTANTCAVYTLAARRFLAMHPGAIAPDAVVRYVMACTTANLAPATIAAHVAALKHLLAFMRQRGEPVPPEAEMAPLNLPRVRTAVAPTLTRDELALYAELCRDVREPYSTLMRLLPLSGLRVSEACGLRIPDLTPPGIGEESYVIDVRPNAARGVKGVADRRVVVLSVGTPMLAHYTSEVYPTLPGFRGSASEWVFPQADGAPVKRRGVAEEFRRLRKRMGREDLSPHACRHAHATLLEEAGWSLFAVMGQLGHESADTTSRYVHGSVEKRQRMMGSVNVEGDWS
jgi:site-specific recombinase XerD